GAFPRRPARLRIRRLGTLPDRRGVPARASFAAADARRSLLHMIPTSGTSPADARLCLHHVGGRSGTTSFPVLPCFEHDFIRVLYDADEDCLPQARERNRDLKAEVHVLPYCLAAASGVSDLFITYDPFNTSLRKSNPRYHRYY